MARLQGRLEDQHEDAKLYENSPPKVESQAQKVTRVDPKALVDVCHELRLKLQIKAFPPAQVKDFFFKPYQSDAQVSIAELQEIFDNNGIDEKKSLLLARYLVEPRGSAQLVFDASLSRTQREVVTLLQDMVGAY